MATGVVKVCRSTVFICLSRDVRRCFAANNYLMPMFVSYINKTIQNKNMSALQVHSFVRIKVKTRKHDRDDKSGAVYYTQNKYPHEQHNSVF